MKKNKNKLNQKITEEFLNEYLENYNTTKLNIEIKSQNLLHIQDYCQLNKININQAFNQIIKIISPLIEQDNNLIIRLNDNLETLNKQLIKELKTTPQNQTEIKNITKNINEIKTIINNHNKKPLLEHINFIQKELLNTIENTNIINQNKELKS